MFRSLSGALVVVAMGEDVLSNRLVQKFSIPPTLILDYIGSSYFAWNGSYGLQRSTSNCARRRRLDLVLSYCSRIFRFSARPSSMKICSRPRLIMKTQLSRRKLWRRRKAVIT